MTSTSSATATLDNHSTVGDCFPRNTFQSCERDTAALSATWVRCSPLTFARVRIRVAICR